jgi:putative membrane protein
MRVISIILSVLLIGIVLLFSFQNRTAVTVLFLNWSATLPVAILVIAAYILGMVSGGSVMSFLRRSFNDTKKKPE